MKRVSLVLVVLLIAATFAFANGAQQPKSSDGITMDPGPVGRYNPGLTITTWRSLSNRQYPDGQTWDDNIWTRYIEDKLGIKFDYVWSVPNTDFNAKVNVSIVSGDLPDYMQLPYDAWYTLGSNGQLADLTKLVDTYDMPFADKNVVLKTPNGFFHDSLDFANGLARQLYSVDGKLYGLGEIPSPYGSQQLWIRDDWRKAVGADLPKSMDDAIKLMYSFTNNDPDGDGVKDTYGLLLQSTFFGGGSPMEAFFTAWNAYPEMWVKSGNGIVWGSTTPENKEVLRTLQKMMADGVLNPEWPALGTWSESPDELVKQKVGISTAQSWFGDWQTTATIIADPQHDATWTAMPVPKVGGGYATGGVKMSTTTVYAMNAKFAHPEALLKINLLHEEPREPDKNGNDPYHTMVTDSGEKINSFFYYNDFFGTFGLPGYNEAVQKLVTEALAKRDPSILPNPESVGYYNRAITWLDNHDADGYRPYSTFGPNGGMAVSNYIYDNGLYKLDEFYGSNTPAMNDYLGDIKSQRLEIWSRIIFGDLSVDDGWQQWIDYWNAQGGQEITKEANQWWQTFGRK